MPIAGQTPRDGIDQPPAHGRRNAPIQAPVALVQVAVVATEQLVAADTGENDGDILPRELGNQVRRDERGIRHRLIHVPDELRQQ